MADFDYDLFVIGAGSGGVRAARLAAQAGARVAIAEEYRIGGTCVIRGCVPKKLLVYASEYAQGFADARGFGWSVDFASFDWPALRENVQQEVARLSGLYRANLERAGVEIFEERASLSGGHDVRMARSGRSVAASKILIATGGRPSRLANLKGEELAITSNEVFHLERLPARIAVIGGGYIALEFGTIFSGLGVETTLVYRGDRILRGFDDDVRAHVQDNMQRLGVTIVTGATPQEIADAGGVKLVTLSNGMRLEADEVLLAVGREPNTEGLGLEDAGVALTERGAVAVNAYSRSSAEHIFALGDVTDRLCLTPVAIREAVAFIETEFRGQPMSVDHDDVATAVFCRPAIGTVGLSEAEARARFGEVHVYKAVFRPMKNILAGNEERTLMKLIVHPGDDRVLGVHIAGPEGPELAQLAGVAVKARLTKAQWDATCAVHPTAAEELVLLRERAS